MVRIFFTLFLGTFIIFHSEGTDNNGDIEDAGDGKVIEDKHFWYRLGKEQLKRNKETFAHKDRGSADNIIVFIGDGMGPSTVTAARYYHNLRKEKSEGEPLHLERLPYAGTMRTYDVDFQVTESAASATAIFTGSKTKHFYIGLDATVKNDSCNQTNYENGRLSSIAEWAVNGGKWVGIVTTTRITDATPAALYAKALNPNWQCSVPTAFRKCYKDIATQLVENFPGKKIRVILGGGRDVMGIVKTDYCNSRNRSLVDLWRKSKKRSAAHYVKNTEELEAVDYKKTDYLLGLFSEGDMPFNLERDPTPEGQPSLVQMTRKAIEVLRRNKRGYLLLVESGLIDKAHHMNAAKLAVDETKEMDKAVGYAMNATKDDETLLIVTADHSHGLSMSGYPARKSSLWGKNGGYNWTKLVYAIGPGARRENLSSCELDVSSSRYISSAGFYSKSSVHSGEDVGVFARGPGAHLLVGCYESSFIAHVIGYAAGISGCSSHKVFCYGILMCSELLIFIKYYFT